MVSEKKKKKGKKELLNSRLRIPMEAHKAPRIFKDTSKYDRKQVKQQLKRILEDINY